MTRINSQTHQIIKTRWKAGFLASKFDKPLKYGNLKGAEKENHLGEGGRKTNT